MVDIIKNGVSASTSTKTTEGKPDVVVLLDASGSMGGNEESVVSTFNEYVEKVKDSAHSISLYMFDSQGIKEKILRENPSRVRKMTVDDYKVGLMTPLYDAMGKVMNEFNNSDRNVQFVTHTDGLENDSKEWNYQKLKEYIETLTKKGWLFIYLGEGIEGAQEMQKFQGIKMNFSPANRGATMEAFVGTTVSYAAGASNDLRNYTDSLSGTIDIDNDEKVKPWIKQAATAKK